mgnify:CR=1 FL=1
MINKEILRQIVFQQKDEKFSIQDSVKMVILDKFLIR